MIDALDVLRSTVAHKWESMGRFVELHGDADLGDMKDEASAAFHLLHTAEVFRIHATACTGGGLTWDGEAACGGDAAELRDTLLRDIDRFIEWRRAHGDDPSDSVPGRSESDAAEMLGVMIRHIVWHVACAHEWVKAQRKIAG